MQPKYIVDGTTYCVAPVKRADEILLELDGQPVRTRIHWLGKHLCELEVNGVKRRVYAAQDHRQLYIHLDGRAWQVEVLDEFTEAGETGGSAEGLVKAPMPGVVVEVQVKPGQTVAEGQTLLLIESMKLQMEIKTKVPGVVKQLGVDGPGSGFDKGATLVEIDVEGAGELSE